MLHHSALFGHHSRQDCKQKAASRDHALPQEGFGLSTPEGTEGEGQRRATLDEGGSERERAHNCAPDQQQTHVTRGQQCSNELRTQRNNQAIELLGAHFVPCILCWFQFLSETMPCLSLTECLLLLALCAAVCILSHCRTRPVLR
jgi:hypothetical protein